MAIPREVQGGLWTTDRAADERGRRPSAGPPAPELEEPDAQGGAAGRSIADVLHLLGRRGYVRSFEPVGTALWCRSSQTRFDPDTMVVESVTPLRDGIVLALRDTVSGTAGTWIVVGRDEWEHPLLALHTWPPSAIPIRRSTDGAATPTGALVPFPRTA